MGTFRQGLVGWFSLGIVCADLGLLLVLAQLPATGPACLRRPGRLAQIVGELI